MDANKILLGITGTPGSNKRYAARAIREALDLRHYNLRAPIIQACAALADIPQEHFDRLGDNHPLPLLKTTAGELQNRIATTLRLISHDYLIARLCEHMSTDTRTDFLFSGAVISGITTDAEADWLRARGGIVVHLRNTANIRDPHRLVQLHDCDLMHTYTGEGGPSEVALKGLIDTLRERHQARAA